MTVVDDRKWLTAVLCLEETSVSCDNDSYGLEGTQVTNVF